MNIPVAQPGDICVLVEPARDELPRLRRRQKALGNYCGGRPQERIHFTCQRFSLPDMRLLPRVIGALERWLAALPPVPVIASALELSEHPFWEFYVLRWGLYITPALRRLECLLDTTLEAVGADRHYPCGAAWRPHVTALEAIPDPDRAVKVSNGVVRQYLFTGHCLTFSQVRKGKQFAILHTQELGSGYLRERQRHVSGRDFPATTF